INGHGGPGRAGGGGRTLLSGWQKFAQHVARRNGIGEDRMDSVDFDALEQEAQARMAPASFAFCQAGADDEITATANAAAWRRLRLRPPLLPPIPPLPPHAPRRSHSWAGAPRPPSGCPRPHFLPFFPAAARPPPAGAPGGPAHPRAPPQTRPPRSRTSPPTAATRRNGSNSICPTARS